jgi:hypothetical protein
MVPLTCDCYPRKFYRYCLVRQPDSQAAMQPGYQAASSQAAKQSGSQAVSQPKDQAAR